MLRHQFRCCHQVAGLGAFAELIRLNRPFADILYHHLISRYGTANLDNIFFAPVNQEISERILTLLLILRSDCCNRIV